MNLNFNGTVNFHNSVNLSSNSSGLDKAQFERASDAIYNMRQFESRTDLSSLDNVQEALPKRVSNVNEVSPPPSNMLPNSNVSRVTPESLLNSEELYTKRGLLRSKRGRPRARDEQIAKRQNTNNEVNVEHYQPEPHQVEQEYSQDNLDGEIDLDMLDNLAMLPLDT